MNNKAPCSQGVYILVGRRHTITKEHEQMILWLEGNDCYRKKKKKVEQGRGSDVPGCF